MMGISILHPMFYGFSHEKPGMFALISILMTLYNLNVKAISKLTTIVPFPYLSQLLLLPEGNNKELPPRITSGLIDKKRGDAQKPSG